MKRNAISQWELSDHFWAESDPPEPCAAAKSFLQKCVRQFDWLTADNRRVKYRLTSGDRDIMPEPATRPRPPRRSMDRVRGCGCCGVDDRVRTTGTATDNAVILVDDGSGVRDYCSKDATPLQSPPCVIRRADNDYATANCTDRGGTETVPYRELKKRLYVLHTGVCLKIINEKRKPKVGVPFLCWVHRSLYH
ncbi:hypothetical protein AGLY_002642 [Aphis glycines]|uniref:Uncharacterized protein n=1 Tax=Aphis glycines TaxID=307491 RepID=A0A6G0U0U2_APHGL|nr:hypothetical protein AGLY_002642 [Aphis glycines]